jgi:hypothetical protein
MIFAALASLSLPPSQCSDCRGEKLVLCCCSWRGTWWRPWHRMGRADRRRPHKDSGGMRCRVLAWYPACPHLESRAMPEVAVLKSRNTTVAPSRGMATMTSSCVPPCVGSATVATVATATTVGTFDGEMMGCASLALQQSLTCNVGKGGGRVISASATCRSRPSPARVMSIRESLRRSHVADENGIEKRGKRAAVDQSMHCRGSDGPMTGAGFRDSASPNIP